MQNRIYLGDSVYAYRDDYYVIITTENHGPEGPKSNQIFLEPSVLKNLLAYCKEV